jgi:hypothetical protein
MKSCTLNAKWDPKPGFKLGTKDIDGKLTYLAVKSGDTPRLKC